MAGNFFFYCFNYPIWLVNILNLFLLEARILWCSQSDNRSENDLAKFGYILNTKANYFFLKTESFYILGYLLGLIKKKSDNLKKHSSKSGKFGSFFLKWKILCIGHQNHIFQVEIWWGFANKRNIAWGEVIVLKWVKKEDLCKNHWLLDTHFHILQYIQFWWICSNFGD